MNVPQSAEPAAALDMRPHQLGLRDADPKTRRDRVRLRLASWAFTTRRVPPGAVCRILPPSGEPRAGDLVLARIDALGFHRALQLVTGRRRELFAGDEIVVAYGNRYASSQFEATVPRSMGPCHLVAGGGIASRANSWHTSVAKGPTEITPIGLLAGSAGERLNLRDFALEPVPPVPHYHPTVIAVVGTSMDSGKTQTCAHLVRGLIAGGSRAGYTKVTGTGAGGDYWFLRDAGAEPVLDFVDAGYASTYMLGPDEIVGTMVTLIDQVTHHGVDAIVVEIADGVLQRETAALIDSPIFAERVDGIVVAAADSMSAMAAFQWLRERPTPMLALSGKLTAAPLLVGEAAAATGLPTYDREELATRGVATRILALAKECRRARFARAEGDGHA